MPNQVLYGFMNMKDLLSQRVTAVGVGVVNDAIEQSVAEHNRQMDALIGLFARRTTEYKTRYRTSAAARSQPLDNSGRARPIKRAGYYDVSYPLQAAGNAWGADYVTRAKMTVEEANDITATILSGDVRWSRDHVLAALFTNANWTFTDEQHGDLTILGPANNDSVTYHVLSGADASAADNHFLAQASGIADATNPYPTIHSDLIEHPENGGEVVALVSTSLISDTQDLTSFIPIADPNVREGANTAVLTGSMNGVALPGPVRGYADKVWVVEWPSLPSGYIVATTTAGSPALAMREDEEEELRGFKKVAEREDHPFWEAQYLRRAGFGAWNRVGAVVYRVGSGSYAIPTGYDSPMP